MPLINLISWANTNPVDGVSGQNAMIEPSTSKKNSGFLRLERPPRQDLNWLFNNRDNLIKTIRDTNKNMIAGLQLSQFVDEGGGTLWSIEINQGRCLSSNGEMFFDTSIDTGWPGPVLKKFITGGTFVAGDGQPGLSTGATALSSTLNRTYHVFVIRLSSGNIDIGIDSDVAAANLVANHGVTHFRRIFSFLWQGNDVSTPVDRPVLMVQRGDEFFISESNDANDDFGISGGTSGNSDGLMDVPVSIPTIVKLVVGSNSSLSGPQYAKIFGDDQVVFPPTISSADLILNVSGESAKNHVEIPSNGAFFGGRQIHCELDGTLPVGDGVVIRFQVKSYIDRRGQDDI